MKTKEVIIREIQEIDQSWIVSLLIREWSSPIIVSRGKVHDASNLPGFIALQGKNPVGLITYTRHPQVCKSMT